MPPRNELGGASHPIPRCCWCSARGGRRGVRTARPAHERTPKPHRQRVALTPAVASRGHHPQLHWPRAEPPVDPRERRSVRSTVRACAEAGRVALFSRAADPEHRSHARRGDDRHRVPGPPARSSSGNGTVAARSAPRRLTRLNPRFGSGWDAARPATCRQGCYRGTPRSQASSASRSHNAPGSVPISSMGACSPRTGNAICAQAANQSRPP